MPPLYHRRGSSHWWVRIGRKTRLSTGTADREKAEEFEHALSDRLWRLRKLGDRSAVSWFEVRDKWLAASAKPRKRERALIEWLSGKVGREYSIGELADVDVLEQLQAHGLKAGWSHTTVDRMMSTVRSLLRFAAHRRYLPAAPFVPMFNPATHEPHWLTREEFARLERELPPHLKAPARFAVLTLLRMRAMGQLTWDRVDLKARRGWVPKGQMKGAKTFGFPLSREACRLLRQLRPHNPAPGSRIFLYDGEPIDNFHTAAFKKAAKRAGLLPLRWHDLRHTGASWAVQGGVTLPELMALGGWASYRSVLIYAHFAPQHAATAAERVAHREHSRRRKRA